MTDSITGTTNASSTATTGTSELATAASDGADRMISSDFETFLKMLTAQLENQDPLNPLQSTDFAVQLATFSGVEQQVLTNDRLGALTDHLAASSLSSLSSWIGNEVLTDLDVSFDGTPVDLIVPVEPGTVSAELVIRNQSDETLDMIDVSPDGGPFRWDGITTDGVGLSAGTYRLSAISRDVEGNILGESVVAAYQPVVEVVPNGGNPVLSLRGGGTVSAANVEAVRRP